jgi:hypothetical protein
MPKPFYLRRGDIVAVQGADTTVTVAGGDAWITQHGDIKDYVVRDGDWRSESDGLILVHAIQDCQVILNGAAAAKARLCYPTPSTMRTSRSAPLPSALSAAW